MGRLLTMIVALALAIVGCSSGASSTATQAPTAAGPELSMASSKPAATATAVSVSALVTWDGQKCTYMGPSVVPRGAVITFSLQNDPALAAEKQAGAFVMPIVDDSVTWPEILRAAELGDARPSFVLIAEIQYRLPSDSNPLTVVMTRNRYLVMCGTQSAINPGSLITVLAR